MPGIAERPPASGAGPGLTRARRRALLIALAVALTLVGVRAGTALAHAGRGAHWALVWLDSFAGRAGAGASPQSWTYQTGSGVFGNGEIDTATSSRANVQLDGGGALEITAVRGLSSGLQPCPGCQQGYHTSAVVIDRRHLADQHVRWYLDGHQFYSVSESRVGATAWQTAFSQGFAVVLDRAIGGT